MRWHAHHRTGRTGHLYQGRFKSFPIQDDEYLLTVMRSVERNPVRANLMARVEEWNWSSAWAQKSLEFSWLHIPESPPLPSLPRQWRAWVNKPQSEAEVEALRKCIRRGSPFGSDAWSKSLVLRLGLHSTFRPRGRPRKET